MRLRFPGEWSLASVPPGSVVAPESLEAAGPEWIGASGPMTVAAALRAAGRWDDAAPRDLDADDWWYRCRFPGTEAPAPCRIRFEGLATVADAWLNGVHLLHADNMFLAHEVSLAPLRPGPNELLIRFHALAPLLALKRPRPRWKTRLVASQQLRWHRTTLLGRIREWCPPIAPVGPWRGISLVPGTAVRVSGIRLDAGLDGTAGRVSISARLASSPGEPVRVSLTVGETTAALSTRAEPEGMRIEGVLGVDGAEAWWPHTHGAQPLYPAHLTIETRDGTVIHPLGRIGFRTIEVDRGDDGAGFGIRLNGTPVFCRGACWTPLDLVSLGADPAGYRAAIRQARDAGMNMLRVGGTMVYEDAAFYDACDELGVMVWQDFMFANLDYPPDDASFAASVDEEARQLLTRLAGRPSLTVLCGGSEVEQQAAMLGLPAKDRTAGSVTDGLATACSELAPQVAWVPSSPSGGTHPFQSNAGVAHYYGVGAYRRPLDDARRAGVRFASECLAFSNVPDPGARHCTTGVPRDPGADWDFADVRDHYHQLLFGHDPAALRATDPRRYRELGGVVTGEVMARVIGEWRRPESTCRGALVWFLRDLAPGAGWGVVDVTGRAKPAWWYLRRAFAPVALFPSDEGLNGLYYHAVNDTARPVEAVLHATVYRDGRTAIARGSAPVSIPARGAATLHADALFPGFLDLTCAYRFGPPGHDVAAARLVGPGNILLASACYWPGPLPASCEGDLGLTARAEADGCGYRVTLGAGRLAFGVDIRAAGFEPSDNWLHLEPGTPRVVTLRRTGAAGAVAGTVTALNGGEPVAIEVAG